jgi:hypothetical protein
MREISLLHSAFTELAYRVSRPLIQNYVLTIIKGTNDY